MICPLVSPKRRERERAVVPGFQVPPCVSSKCRCLRSGGRTR
ncbi:MAG: hypothetical protein KAS60_07385 [Thermoplasmata archaeon]|nr:hypothetical protein [Thermoplasmata archaeon]